MPHKKLSSSKLLKHRGSCPHSREECPHCGSDVGDTPPHRGVRAACPHSREECPHCGSDETAHSLQHDAPSKSATTGGCKYSSLVHTTEEAHSYHQDKCVTRIMSAMGDTNQCMAYMAGVSEGNPDMAGCSIQNLMDICERKAAQFTQSDAENLCSAINTAHGQFWHSYNNQR